MKIALLSFLYEPELGGGAAVVVNQLAHSLVQKSHSVVVITTWKGSFIRTDYIDGIKIIRIPPMNLYWVGEKDKQSNPKKAIWQIVDIWNPLVYRVIRQILAAENVDIVHTHKLRGLSPSIWSASAAVGIKKIIHTCHDYELLSPEGYFMGKVGKLAQNRNIFMRPYQNLRRHFSRLVHYATAPSKYVLDQHQRMGFFSLATKRIIPNTHGLEIIELEQRKFELLNSPKNDYAKNFIYLGRLDKAKGIDLLCTAFVKAANIKQNMVLRIVGWGPLEESLRIKYQNESCIVFTGPVFGDHKNALIRESDILVAPSIMPEPFGIVIAEAYANGVPVITSRTGAFPEIVIEGETGILVKPGSVDDLYKALTKVNEEHGLVSMTPENCLNAAQKYSFEQFTSNYLHIYEEDN